MRAKDIEIRNNMYSWQKLKNGKWIRIAILFDSNCSHLFAAYCFLQWLHSDMISCIYYFIHHHISVWVNTIIILSVSVLQYLTYWFYAGKVFPKIRLSRDTALLASVRSMCRQYFPWKSSAAARIWHMVDLFYYFVSAFIPIQYIILHSGKWSNLEHDEQDGIIHNENYNHHISVFEFGKLWPRAGDGKYLAVCIIKMSKVI